MSIEHLLEKFHVISVVSNPVRYESRDRLYNRFSAHMEKFGVQHWMCECAFGDRAFTLTSDNNTKTIRFRTSSEVWHKENLINLAVQRLPSDWEYVAWIDADLEFWNENWVRDTIQALQHYPIVQVWQNCVDMGPNQEVIQTHTSMGYLKATGKPISPKWGQTYAFPHPGFAWAARRDKFIPLLDRGVLGSGDHHMAYAILGRVNETLFAGKPHPHYIEMLNLWQERALRSFNKDMGFVPGLIGHNFHGKKRDRGYESRWAILDRWNFDPYRDIVPDWQGLYELTPTKPGFRDDLRRYFRSRNEDSIDLE